jgi:CheY-like chemotaxis protein
MQTGRASRVLVVDSADAARLIRRWGYDARHCGGAEDALTVGLAFRPHVLVAEADRPHLVEQLRERLRPTPLGLVALVGRPDPATRQRCARLGFHFYCVWPVQSDELQLVLDALAKATREA